MANHMKELKVYELAEERIELPCKFGTLVCEVFSNGDFKELAIDLVRPDGKGYQVCVVGTNENCDGLDLFSEEERIEYRDRIHVYLWDGEEPDCCEQWHMNPDGDGYYAD